MNSHEQFAADMLSTILGGGRSSRLYRVLREEKQLVYSIGSSFWTQRGSGVMVLSAVFPQEKEQQVLAAIREQIELLRTNGPTETEMKRARKMEKSQWFFGNETFHDQAALYGYWNMQGNPGMIDRYIAEIEKVSAADVVAFLNKYYSAQGLSDAIIVPKKKAEAKQKEPAAATR
jgi:zinc protease